MWAEIKLAINSTLGNISRFLPLDKIADKVAYEENAKAVRIIHDMQSRSEGVWGDLIVFPWGKTKIEPSDVTSQNLEYCLIPNTVHTIEENAFFGYEYLKGVSLPSRVKVEKNAFAESGLKWVDANNITNIGESSFARCTNLTSFAVSEIEGGTIGNQAFSGCSSLERVYFPKSLTAIGRECFYGCEKLGFFWYSGTVQDWRSVEVAPDAFHDAAVNRIMCTDGYVDI